MKTKVLIVDDEAGVRALLQAVLEPEGHQIYQASNGIQALQLIRKEVPDFVFLDIRIPGISGMEVLTKIKEFTPNIRVFIMTAYSEAGMIEQAKELGASAHLSKPFDVEEVRSLVSKNHQSKEMRSYNSKKVNWLIILSTALLALAAFSAGT